MLIITGDFLHCLMCLAHIQDLLHRLMLHHLKEQGLEHHKSVELEQHVHLVQRLKGVPGG